MKHLIFTCTLSIFSLLTMNAQDFMMVKKDMMVKTDSTKSCCTDCYSNIISVEANTILVP